MGQHVIYKSGKDARDVHVSALNQNSNYWIIHPDFADNESFRPTYPRVLGKDVSATLRDLARKNPLGQL